MREEDEKEETDTVREEKNSNTMQCVELLITLQSLTSSTNDNNNKVNEMGHRGACIQNYVLCSIKSRTLSFMQQY